MNIFGHHATRAFTLVEIMIVIAIVGVLSAVMYPGVSDYLRRAKDARAQIAINGILTVLQQTLIEQGDFYPADFNDILETIDSRWQDYPDVTRKHYCVPLNNVTQCQNAGVTEYPIRPIPELESIPQKYFNAREQDLLGARHPLISRVPITGNTRIWERDIFQHAGLPLVQMGPTFFVNASGLPQYILHWSIEGNQGFGTGEVDIAVGKNRCAPGIPKADATFAAENGFLRCMAIIPR